MAKRRASQKRWEKDIEELVKILDTWGPKRTLFMLERGMYILAEEYYEGRPFLSGVYMATSRKVGKVATELKMK